MLEQEQGRNRTESEEQTAQTTMNYFLRNLPNPFEVSAFACIESEQEMFARIEVEYGELLDAASRRRFGHFPQMELKKRKGMTRKFPNSSILLPNNEKNEAENIVAWEALWKSLELAAAPSPFGAMALAQSLVYRLKNGGNKKMATEWPEYWIIYQMDEQQNIVAAGDSTTAPQRSTGTFNGANSNAIFQQFHQQFRSSQKSTAPIDNHPIKLVSLGLDCIFSVLLELNRRDPELCAQSLQSLLQLLQNMEPEYLGGSDSQSQEMVGRMHELLRELRREGNSNVSGGANACMMSLAVASGQPYILYSTITALICEPKRHLPQNQILADSNPLPRNVQILAQSAQRSIIGNGPFEWSTNVSLDRRPMACEFDVIYTGSALIGEEEQRMRLTSTVGGSGTNGCLVSDGAYVYLLTHFGLLKMGTGLSETRAGEVITCNELLKFTDGSALFISNESLYLRRKHSSRLWVLDTDNLREIGEIMLPSALTSQGQLLADGRQFFHGQLDEKWNFACIPLDDSFGPCQQEQYSPPNGSSTTERRMPTASVGPKTRLIKTEFCAFGGVDDAQTRLLQSIPPKLRGIAADVQLGTGIGFLLSRCGKIFYAGPEAEAGFNLPCSQKISGQFEWKRLSLLEPIVQMALESTNRTLILRSGAGNLWMVGGGQWMTKSAGKLPKSPKKRQKEDKIVTTIRRLKVPNKRKCTSLSVASVGGGCLAFATDNGRCFLLGRHVLNTGTVGNIIGPPMVQSSPATQTPFLVPGLENIPIAQVALGKTHYVAIGKNGAVYATGLNNQNQCGHSQDSSKLPSSTKTMPTEARIPPTSSTIYGNQSTSSHQNQQQQQSSSSLASFCSSSCSPSSSHSHQFCSQYSQHFFLDDLASRCVRCGLCSIRGAACNFTMAKGNSDVIVSSTSNIFCPCARTGPSCCLRCGLCRNCAEEKRKERKADNNGFSQNAEKQHRIGMSPKAVRLQLSSRREMLGLGNAPLAKHEFVEEEVTREAVETEKTKIVPESAMSTRIFGPERVLLQQQPTIKVASISVGNFHTVVLSADNQVYIFGANTFGQLGTGTTGMIRSGAHKLSLSANVQVVQAVAGANHTVLRTLDGRLITFGAYKAGQLGRKRLAMPVDDSTGVNSSLQQSTRQWFAEPGFVPGFGQAYGRVASWVSAQGDRTLVQVQHQLLSRVQLTESRITANGECLMIAPPTQNNSQGRPLSIGNSNKGGYLMVKRANAGNGPSTPDFRHFQWPEMGDEGNGLSKCSFCLDPKHGNLLWVYDSQKMCVFALSSSSISSASIELFPLFLRHHRQMLLRSTELMVPSIMDSSAIVANGQNGGFGLIGSADCSPARYSDCQMGLFLLSNVYSLCLAAVGGKIDGQDEMIEFGNEIVEDYSIECQNLSSLEPKEEEERGMDCRVINRFENFGGGWGYSAHCVEAIQFKTNKDILFCGVGLFGGRGEYTARVKLFRVLEDLDSPSMTQQQCIELLAETDEVLYECGTRETAVLQLERPIPIGKQRWHVIWVQIIGPSSDCGAAGKAIVRIDDENGQEQVEFHFRQNALSNNGTNVEVGQIPEFYFLTPSDVDDPEDILLQQTPKRRPMVLRGNRKCVKIDGNSRKASFKCQQFIKPSTLFNIHTKSICELLRIVEWALESGRAFLESDQEQELLDCDYAWRQERAALIAILAIRLIRLALCLLPLNGGGISSNEEKLGPTQVLAFHRLLRQILERKIHPEDKIGTFFLAEVVSSYVICAHLFSPSVELLRTRIVEQLGYSERNSWWFLALLCSLERMDGQILTIFSNENEKNRNYGGGDELIEAFMKAEIRHQQYSPQAILNGLFELAFTEMQEEDEGALGRGKLISDDSQQIQWNSSKFLQMQLKASALRLLGAIGQHLVVRCKPSLFSESSPSEIPLQTPSRFRHISTYQQWDVGGSDEAWDAIGFTVRIEEDTRLEFPPTILLCGVGIFSGNSSSQMPNSFELEFLQTANSEDWHLLERVVDKLDSFPTQIVHFTRQWPLHSDVNYALKLHFTEVGKTLYGEGGHASLQLADQCRLHFMPSGMSQNGSTVARGQFPFLVYSLAQNCPQKDEKDGTINCCANSKDEFEQKLFLQLLRFIVQILGKRIANRSSQSQERILSKGEQTLCTNILGQINLLLKYRNELGFDVVAVIDETIPILANINNSIVSGKKRRMTLICQGNEEIMKEYESGSSLINGMDEEEDENDLNIHQRHNQSKEQKNSQPIWLESAHPYRAGQICIHKVAFSSAHSLSIRFDPLCKIAHQLGDSLWIYSAKEKDYLFPIGQFNQNWLRGRTLTVPGNKLYFLFESDQRAESESDENCFGFRCSIEPIMHYSLNQISSNHSLEHHFIWSLANACRHLLQIGSHKMEEEMKAIRELLLNRHAKLARRGIRVGNGRMATTLGQLLRNEWGTEEEEEKAKEQQFMEEFAKGEPLNSVGALLATAICQNQSFIHLGHSQLQFTPIGPSREIRLGQPVKVHFVARDQHNREVVATEGIEVELVLTNGNGIDENLAKSSMAEGVAAIDWAKLKTEQTKCQFRPMPTGRALYQCISLLPPLQDYSLEELRFSFAYGQPSKERFQLTRSLEGTLLANWTPKRAGPVIIQCLVDGRPLASSQIPKLEVYDNGVTSELISTAPISHSLCTLRTQNPALVEQNDSAQINRPAISPLRRAHFPSVSHYLAIRVRAHPSLNATQIGQVGRGTWLDFTEILRNNDGVWLRLGEASRNEIKLGREAAQKEQNISEAWILQMNAHLQTEYLQMTPPSNGNFIVSPSNTKLLVQTEQLPITTISILDSPKFRQKRAAEQFGSISPSADHPRPALGPALLKAFRWTFCAVCWHSGPEADIYPTVEEMMEAASWLESKTELAVNKICQNRKQWNELPANFHKILLAWNELNEQLWKKIEGRENGEKIKSEAENDLRENAKNEGKNVGNFLAQCELCSTLCTKPIGIHMRQMHPGCGGPTQTYGYNSAGHWTTGWSGKCGEVGQGKAVWYLLCARCRQQYLPKVGNSSSFDQNIPMAERLKRNALFLLKLNRDERIVAQQNREGKYQPVISIDLYPEVGHKIGVGIMRNKKAQWHMSDPGYQLLDEQTVEQPSSSSAIANLGETEKSGDLIDTILDFVFVQHDLAKLRSLFRQSHLRAVTFSFAFRIWNWLLKVASVEQSSYDVVWHFFSALHQFSSPNSTSPLLPHPAHLCLLAGPQQIGQMIQQFHCILQQLTSILQSPRDDDTTVDGRLRCLCFRALNFQLTGHEQALLPTIRSLLSAVGNVLGCSSVDRTTAAGHGGTMALSTTNNSAESAAVVGESMPKSCSNGGVASSPQLQQLDNLMENATLRASSRAQLLGCLLDGSCETFWESGEEDRGRGRPRKLIISNWCGLAKFGTIYVNNAKDEGFRVERIIVMINECDKEGENIAEIEPKSPLLDIQLEKNFCGWLKFGLNFHYDNAIQLKICLYGDDMGCRLRQLCLFGLKESSKENILHKWQQSAVTSSIRPSNSQQQLLFGGIQGDAFSLFQSLATQVFGDDFVGDGEGGQQEGTLREQVMDLLFSRSQLQPLQSFVGVHVSNAIEREIANLRFKRKRNFSYVSVLLQMLGRMFSANQSSFIADPNLLQILSQFCLFASETICKQTAEICAKILVQCRAENFTKCMPEFVENMLILVAKAISIQLKEKIGIGKRQRTMEKLSISTHLAEAPPHWCLQERSTFISPEAAQLCIRILRQKTGILQAQMRAAVASHLLRLSTHLRDSLAKGRPLINAIRCPQFWLAIASLGTMDGPEWLEMVPEFRQMRIEKSRATKDPLCENHDDGRTLAQLHCQTCNISLCRECFSVLHLSRRNQTHRARLIGSALTPLPNVDFHEGCHRLRVGQQLLILLNPKSLAGLVELDTENGLAQAASGIGRSRSSIPSSSSSMSSFQKSSQEMPKLSICLGNGKVDNGNGDEYCMKECREEEVEDDEEDEERNCHSPSLLMEGKCRFCGTQLAAEQLLNGICKFEECRQKQADACPNSMPCGHWCSGIHGHQQCGPCLHCPSAEKRQDADDLCAICLCERLGESPCLVLEKCQHIFHWKCLRLVLEQKWPSGPRISFRFMQCPLCKIRIEHPALEDLLGPLHQLQADVTQKARMRLEYEGLLNNVAGNSTISNLLDDQNALLEMALTKYIYVQCSRCGKAYFGGDARCQQQLEESGLAERAFDPKELICGGCAFSSGVGMASDGGICGRHGTDFLEFKCRFCCSVAIYFCFGSTHFCAGCHGDFQRLISMPKSALPKCPAGPRGQQLDTTELCPLQIVHPPAGEEFALGCGICRNLDTF